MKKFIAIFLVISSIQLLAKVPLTIKPVENNGYQMIYQLDVLSSNCELYNDGRNVERVECTYYLRNFPTYPHKFKLELSDDYFETELSYNKDKKTLTVAFDNYLWIDTPSMANNQSTLRFFKEIQELYSDRPLYLMVLHKY